MTTVPATRAAEPLARFAERLLDWHALHGRHDLPWQRPRTPYRVWLSEIMLQQTQVATVIPYFQRFVAALPDLRALANAPLDDVLALWSGLGYYSRARNLHAAARHCLARHDGELPADHDALLALPGIGRSTAGAILAQAWDRPAAILDGNVKRVLCRSHGIDGFPGSTAVEKQLWRLSERLLPASRLADYTQAIMDLGATVCTRSRPDCERCVLAGDCVARRDDRIGELPTPRPRRSQPQRSACWLVLLDSNERILLERRPPSGIWGGLWSLPEYPDEDALRSDLVLRLGRHSQRLDPLPPIRHVFSHYTLTAQPLLCRLDHTHIPDQAADGDRQGWYLPAQLDRIGLPQPIRSLLTDGDRFDPLDS